MRCNNCCNMGCKNRFTSIRILVESGQRAKLYIGNKEIDGHSNDHAFPTLTTIPGNSSIRFADHQNDITFDFNFKCRYLPEEV